jgi:VWFA-related protein
MQQQPSRLVFQAVILAAVLFSAIGWTLDQQQTASDAKNGQAAQAAPKPATTTGQVPTFTSRTDLVLVPVIVHDRSGAHVNGLSKEDFDVEENGKSQKIAVFEEVTTAAATRVKRASIAPGVFTNTLQASSTMTPRINIVVLDTINTAFADQAYARRHLIDFLEKSVARNEMTALLVLSQSGVKVIHDFTTDPAVLVAAIRKVRGGTNATTGENTDALITSADTQDLTSETADIQSFMEASSARVAQQFAIQATLDCFSEIANGFRGLPGRKALIWVTGSFPFQMSSPNDPPTARDFTDDLWKAFQKLNDANVAVYPIDARGLVTLNMDASTRVPGNMRGGRGLAQLSQARSDNHLDTLATMNSFAEATGGRAFYNTNDLEKAFERASDDSSSYYLLGYYRAPDDNRPGWRKLKVKMNKPGLSLRARTGYFVNAKANQAGASQNEDVKIALRAPMDFTGLPLAVRWEDPAKPEGKPFTGTIAPGKKQAIFNISIGHGGLFFDQADTNHMEFQIVAVARTATGEDAGTFAQTIDAHPKPETMAKLLQGGLSYRNELQVPPGEYSVRFVVRDLLGNRVGSVLAPLKVE